MPGVRACERGMPGVGVSACLVCAVHGVCVPMMCVCLVSQSQCVWLAIACVAFVLYEKCLFFTALFLAVLNPNKPARLGTQFSHGTYVEDVDKNSLEWRACFSLNYSLACHSFPCHVSKNVSVFSSGNSMRKNNPKVGSIC